jgi:hypothetical protein
MSAHRLARAIIDHVRQRHFNHQPAWLAELSLRDDEKWVEELLEPVLREQFEQGLREGKWAEEEKI